MADEKTPKLTIEPPAPAAPAADEKAQAETTETPAADAAPAAEPAAADAAADPATQTVQSTTRRIQAWVHETFPGNEHAFWGGVCGLVIALVFFAIGLWRTLVILVLVLAGVGLGQLRDGKTGVVDAVQRFFSNNR